MTFMISGKKILGEKDPIPRFVFRDPGFLYDGIRFRIALEKQGSAAFFISPLFTISLS